MSLRVGSIIAFGVIAMASPVAGQGKESGDITVTARDQEAEEQVVVCKYQANTGTRFKTKNCRTKLQWEQLRIQQQRDAKEMFDRPTVETRRGG